MERSSRNFQPSSSCRKLQAIFASPNRYFPENSRWVPLISLPVESIALLSLIQQTKIQLIKLDNSTLTLHFQIQTSVPQKNTTVTSLDGAITPKDPSTVLVGKGILKMEKINVQVTLQDLLIETLRYFVATSLSHQFLLFESVFPLNSP